MCLGGYDGSNRLNDFLEFRFGFGGADIPASSLVTDLKQLVNSELLSDVTFVVEGQEVPAHKVLCLRCPYFRALLTGDMRESLMDRIAINDVRKDIFLRLLEYLYTDDVEVDLDMAMELFQAADQFGVERLKRMCESRMLGSIHVENAATIFHAADQHAAASLREKCLAFVLANFDAVTRTQAFEEMGRTNVDLVFEILKARNGQGSRACVSLLHRAAGFSPRVRRLQGPLATGKTLGKRAPANQRRSRIDVAKNLRLTTGRVLVRR